MQKLRYFAPLALCLALVPCASAQRTRQDHSALARFQNALKHDGFDVSTGAAVALNLGEAYCSGISDSAWYSNSEPYIGLLIPKSADDPTPVADFQLRADEAIVLIGLTPPPVEYFGFHPFLSTRAAPPGGTRLQLHATLGDAVNNATVKTTGLTPYNSPVALIFTPDQTTDARIREALKNADYPEAIANTVVFPASMLELGHGENADELRIALRSGPVWQNQTEGEAYVANPPLIILRVTPHNPAPPHSFPAPRLRVRGTGQTEMDLMNKLKQLRQRIIADNSGLQATDLRSNPYWYEGYDYIQRGVDASGDTRDAFFLTAGWVPEYGATEEITLADDEFLMVYGANHVATGKATYMSVNVYASGRKVDGKVVEEGKLLAGSIIDEQFPKGADQTYAYKVSRNCGKQEQCLQLSVPQGCTRLILDSSTLLGLVFRAYLEPTTKVGPAMPEILYDRVMKFSPRSQAPQ